MAPIDGSLLTARPFSRGAQGYSLHQTGIAMDLTITYRGTIYGPKTAQATAWRNTWLFNWPSANAATYRFHQNTSINEPWHWESR